MRTVFVIFGALLLGYCRGQAINEIFDINMGLKADRPIQCGPNSFCVSKLLCKNGIILVYGETLVSQRFNYEKCPIPDECCRLNNEEQSQPPVENKPNCGTRTIIGLRKEASNQALFGEYPWLLQLKGNTEDSFYGAASLIHPQIALTAAHTVENIPVNELRVYAGVWSTDYALNTQPHQIRSVSEIVLHERYKRKGLRYDIALLILSSEFQLQSHINTVCLPPPNFEIPLITCYGTGWGQIAGSSTFSNVPKKIDLPTQTNVMCQRYLRDTALTQFFTLHKTFMCAGGDAGKDVCLGDGGSPLVCPVTGKLNTYYQIGIVSWGMGCGKVDVPGVYANVAYLREWVDIKVLEKGFDPSFYTQ